MTQASAPVGRAGVLASEFTEFAGSAQRGGGGNMHAGPIAKMAVLDFTCTADVLI